HYLYENLDPKLLPVSFQKNGFKYEGNFSKLCQNLFSKFRLIDSSAFQKLFNKDFDVLKKDPVFMYYSDFKDHYFNYIYQKYDSLLLEITNYQRLLLTALKNMNEGQSIYPDANGTLRISYGKIKGYTPRDAVYYDYYTSFIGIFEKNRIGNNDFDIPARLFNLSISDNFGEYNVNGILPVSFIATNHTSGGNSGSPVLNEYGKLIGLNYDRCWEGTMSDYEFENSICRNISVDVHYILFIIDKYAGCEHIIRELEIE
ncbi:S46 family peptidase, partial [Bacteroidota bacterium]